MGQNQKIRTGRWEEGLDDAWSTGELALQCAFPNTSAWCTVRDPVIRLSQAQVFETKDVCMTNGLAMHIVVI